MNEEYTNEAGLKAVVARWTVPVLVLLAVNALLAWAAIYKVGAAFGWMMER